MIAILWVVLAAFCGYLAHRKGRSFLLHFLLSLLLSPLIGFIVGLITSTHPQKILQSAVRKGELKRCVNCAEFIQSQAKVCKYCRREVPVVYEHKD